MPIRINEQMPVVQRLEEKNIFVMSETRASTQDIRELEIAILNLMPNKEDTEYQLLRLLSNTPLQIKVTFLRLDSHQYRHVSEEYLHSFYSSFSEVRHRAFDGLIITGAPVENLPFEQVDYWNELQDLLAWSKYNVTSTMYICWAAQAGLYYHYGIQKQTLPAKLSGIYSHRTLNREEILIRGFDDTFWAPHSRYTGISSADIKKHPELSILAESEEAGPYLIHDKGAHRIFVCGHPEYSRLTLANEYHRDVAKGINPQIPINYFPGNDPSQLPIFSWKSQAFLLFANWINYEVYQITPYDLGRINITQ